MPEVELQLTDKSMYGEKGRIETISGVVDRNTGTASLRAVFPNKNGLLYSGTSGNVILPVTMKGSLVIPQATTFEIQDITYVYKVVDGKAQSAPVSVTRVNGGQEYIVNDGLKEGDIIVAEGVGLLREGTPIKVNRIKKDYEFKNLYRTPHPVGGYFYFDSGSGYHRAVHFARRTIS